MGCGGHLAGNPAEALAPVDALDARERSPDRAPCDSGNGGPATVAPHATPSPPLKYPRRNETHFNQGGWGWRAQRAYKSGGAGERSEGCEDGARDPSATSVCEGRDDRIGDLTRRRRATKIRCQHGTRLRDRLNRLH